MTYLEEVLLQLFELTDKVRAYWIKKLREVYEEEDYEPDGDVWLALELARDGFGWVCGWHSQEDEATEWVIKISGNRPTMAAELLLEEVQKLKI